MPIFSHYFYLQTFVIPHLVAFSSVKFSSVAQSCPTLCNPMNHSAPGLPVHHQLPEFTQTHVHRVSDAIQPSHPLSSPSSPSPSPSQHQSLFQWVNSSHEVAKVLEFQLYHRSFQRNPRADLLQKELDGSPCSPRDSQESSPTSQFKSINSLVLSFLHSPLSHPHMTTRKTIALTRQTFVGKVMSLHYMSLIQNINYLLQSSNLYMQRTSWETLGWKKHKLESRLLGEISITSDMQITPLMAESEEELKSLLMRVKEESEKVGLKLNLQKTKIMASGPIASWEIDGETVKTVSDFIFGGSKITQMVTAATKLKVAYSLEGKLWPT